MKTKSRMEARTKFTNLLAVRRKDCDILWVSRPMDPLLPHKLPPESRYTRNQIIQSVLTNTKVQRVVKEIAAKTQTDVSKLEKQVYDMVYEMASKAHLPTVRWLGFFITKAVKQLFSSFYINEESLLTLKKQMQSSQVQYIYVPSHRSYADFVLLSYILFSYDMALPNIASGMDFYRMRIVGELLRKTGAFYMRRTFSTDHLYKEVFRAYVMSIMKYSSRAIEFFIEGTRSRSQKSIVPKCGLLSIILDSFLMGGVPEIHFVPIGISYERPVEETLFAYELLGVPKPKESTSGLLRSVSILQKPQAHGCVFFNFGEPIPASKFIDTSTRKTKVIYPDTRLPHITIERLAYSIIDSQQRNTVLTPFNLIALLYNERVQVFPDSPYDIATIINDYIWIKRFISYSLGAIVYPVNQNTETSDLVKKEILETLKVHQELLAFDPADALRLKERHNETGLEKQPKVKGHVLSAKTMRIAVPVINLIIYVNPVLNFLTKPMFAVLTVKSNGIQYDEALKRYHFIRTLFRTEFALPASDVSSINEEWLRTVDLLQREECLRAAGDSLTIGENTKLYSLLHNLMLPFIDAAYITCITLLEFDDSNMQVATEQEILKKCQEKVEQAFFEGGSFCHHPYSLNLDLFSAILSNLSSRDIIRISGSPRRYIPNKLELSKIASELANFMSERPGGRYIDLILYSPETAKCVQAKL